MNLPNKLTILRILLVPVCAYLAAVGEHIPAAVVFAVAALTDTLDGIIARKRHLVTNFGKFADPIADKVLVLSMLIALTYRHVLPVWLPIVVVFRELMVDGLRMVAAEHGMVVPAGWSGKIKTVSQMILILIALLTQAVHPLDMTLLSVIVCALTLYSGLEYFLKLSDLFKGDFGK